MRSIWKCIQIPKLRPVFGFHLSLFYEYFLQHCLWCFDAVGWVAGRASGCKKIEWLGSDMVIFLERGADLHMAQLMPLPLTVSCFGKIQIGFPVLVPARRQMCVCVCVCVFLQHWTPFLCLWPRLVSVSSRTLLSISPVFCWYCMGS